MHEIFPAALAGATAEDLFRAVNRVQPSLIRVEADEVTYNLHILLRFELELGVLARASSRRPTCRRPGTSATSDCWGFGRRTMRSACCRTSTGRRASSATSRRYTLGNLYSAMLWRSYAGGNPQAGEQIGRGEFAPLLEWLRERVHRRGAIEDADVIIGRATGAELSAQPFVDYLWAKYGDLYGLTR